jgi:hypothetical protein
MAAAFTTPLVAGHLPKLPDGLILGRLIDGLSKTSKKFGDHTYPAS